MDSQLATHSPSGEESFLKKQGYSFSRTLGEGSYGKVKLSELTVGNVKERYACKIICKKKAPKDFITKFLARELDIIKKLDHDNVIRLKSVFDFESRVFIFMEVADNGDLLSYIKRNGAQKNEEAKHLFSDLCSGIAYCHSIDVVHRDLKCENLLLSKDGKLKVADFGFARYCTDPSTGRRILSRTYCGSAAYAAPEILKGNPYNPKMYDVWSMGCVLFIIVCASMPFDDSNMRKMLRAQIEKRIHFPSRVRGQIAESCKKLILRMLEVDITKRATVDQCLRSEWLTASSETLAESAAGSVSGASGTSAAAAGTGSSNKDASNS